MPRFHLPIKRQTGPFSSCPWLFNCHADSALTRSSIVTTYPTRTIVSIVSVGTELNAIRVWWEEWEWFFKAIATIAGAGRPCSVSVTWSSNASGRTKPADGRRPVGESIHSVNPAELERQIDSSWKVFGRIAVDPVPLLNRLRPKDVMRTADDKSEPVVRII
jgi:hypothetical protein